MVFNVGQDPTKHKSGMTFDFTHNGQESLEYGINIIDHAVEPMQQSIIVVRQLVQALQKMQQAYYTSLEEK